VVSANLPVIRPVLQKIWPATMFSKLGTTGRSKEYGGSKDAFALHGFQRQPRDEFQRLPETHVDANSITTLSRDDPEHGVFLPN